MIALYIIIGIAVGAVAVYLLLNPKVGRLHVELARKETEMQMLSQQRTEEQRKSEERFNEERRKSEERFAEETKLREKQFEQQLQTTREQLQNMAQQLMDAQAKKLKDLPRSPACVSRWPQTRGCQQARSVTSPVRR